MTNSIRRKLIRITGDGAVSPWNLFSRNLLSRNLSLRNLSLRKLRLGNLCPENARPCDLCLRKPSPGSVLQKNPSSQAHRREGASGKVASPRTVCRCATGMWTRRVAFRRRTDRLRAHGTPCRRSPDWLRTTGPPPPPPGDRPYVCGGPSASAPARHTANNHPATLQKARYRWPPSP